MKERPPRDRGWNDRYFFGRPANSVLRRGRDLLLAGGFPVLRRQLSQLMVGRRGQAGQDVPEVFVGLNLVQPAVGNERVDNRIALAGFFRPEEQEVLFSDRRWPNDILPQVIWQVVV